METVVLKREWFSDMSSTSMFLRHIAEPACWQLMSAFRAYHTHLVTSSDIQPHGVVQLSK